MTLRRQRIFASSTVNPGVNPHPRNNISVRLPHPLCLKDPGLEAATVRLQNFFRETFWCNEDFFTACCAAIALAKRGVNIDRCFIGESPSGTGQSLYSSHFTLQQPFERCVQSTPRLCGFQSIPQRRRNAEATRAVCSLLHDHRAGSAGN